MSDAGNPDSVFPGRSTMAALMRAHDWAASPLGPVRDWPAVLRDATRICLTSRFPMIVWWGPELRFLYNDDYLPLLGSKHPALGREGRQVWGDIWDVIGPMLDGVLGSGQPTWSEDLLLVMNRHGYWEETYWTYSYSPLYDDDRAVRGVFTAVSETTERVIGERRLSRLQDLGARSGTARTVDEACALVGEALGQAQSDVPYYALYLAGDEPAGLTLAAVTEAARAEAAPELWPLAQALAGQQPVVLPGLPAAAGELPRGGWRDPPAEAMVLPLPGDAGQQPIGALVLAASAGHRLDAGYRTFMELLARQAAALINGAIAVRLQQRRAEELAELDRAKTAFFSNISHEFRTPLTLIMGPVAELRRRLARADDDVREDLDVVYRNGLRLGKLVNALLDFSRIEAGGSQARYEPVDLGSFTAELASVFRAAFQRAGLAFEVDCPPLAEPVYVDREMWEKVVLNLLSNALKYTFAGSVAISVAAEGSQVVLRVADTGIGIPAREMPRLFERFHRGTGVRARSNEGSGIGLALVKELVSLHGGTISAASAPGSGSAFTVRLPFGRRHLPAGSVMSAPAGAVTPIGAEPFVEEALRWLPSPGDATAAGAAPAGTGPAASPTGSGAAGAAAGGAAGAAAPAPSGPDRPAVLIADDNSDMREYLQRLLAGGYAVTATADGEAALAAARSAPPDLVVSDVMMPGLGGLDLVQALRSDPRTAAVPVLLLSARAGQEAAVEGLEAGADDYLVKPFAARELLARVRANIDLTRLRGQQARWRGALTESLQEGFFVAAADGSLVEVNSAFGTILGYGQESAPYPLPHPWWPDPQADPDGYRLAADTFSASRVGRDRNVVLPLRHRDGHRIWAAFSFAVIDDPAGGGELLVGTVRDVTAERLAAQREAAVAAMTSRLSQAATGDTVLAEGLAGLRKQWDAPRVLAAVWEDNGTPVLTSAPPGASWDALDPRLQQTIESVRAQPPLLVTATGGDPAGAGTAVEYSGSAAAVWIELDQGRVFGVEDRTLLALLSGSLGLALNRARLLDQQRDVALALQHGILGPVPLPPGFAVRYEPATPPLEVGGDWYDIAELDNGRIGIIVGDCVGRGLGAASVMGQLRSACRALLLQSGGPAYALTALDRFAELLPDALCSTVFCGVLDPAAGRLTYASAGHPPGILAHADGSAELLEQGRSLPLALAPGHPRSQATAQVPPGSRLLLYTDGLIERRRLPLDEGLDRVTELMRGGRGVPVDDLAQEILDRMQPGQGFEDDVALLLYFRPAPLDVVFPADPDELAPARRQLRVWLGQLSLATETAQDLLIAACEACANAIEHGYHGRPAGPVRLHAEVAGPGIRVTVSDHGRWRSPRQVPFRGNGLKLIRATMQDVTITTEETGTSVEMSAAAR